MASSKRHKCRGKNKLGNSVSIRKHLRAVPGNK